MHEWWWIFWCVCFSIRCLQDRQLRLIYFLYFFFGEIKLWRRNKCIITTKRMKKRCEIKTKLISLTFYFRFVKKVLWRKERNEEKKKTNHTRPQIWIIMEKKVGNYIREREKERENQQPTDQHMINFWILNFKFNNMWKNKKKTTSFWSHQTQKKWNEIVMHILTKGMDLISYKNLSGYRARKLCSNR